MSIDPVRIIVSMINFAILYFILKHYFFNAVNAVIENRQKEIKENIDNAEKSSTEAEALKAEREQSLRLLKEETNEIIEFYREKAEGISDEIVSGAKEEARIMLERARNEIFLEQEKAKAEIKKEVVQLSMMFAEKAIAVSVDEDVHRKLISDFIGKVDKLDV